MGGLTQFIMSTPWGPLTPIPPPRKYPAFSEEGLRELWMSLETRDFTWESFNRAAFRSMPKNERERWQYLFKDESTGEYKKRSPSMTDFITTVLNIEFFGQWEFDRQEEFEGFVRNVEHRVDLAILMDGEAKDYKG